MIRQRLALALALIALIAVLRYLRPPEPPPEALPEAQASYRLEDFDLTVMNPDGLPRFTVAAPSLARRPDDGSAMIEAPRMRLFTRGRPAWAITSERCWIADSGDEVRLLGDVRMVGLGDEPVTVTTEALVVFPDTDQVRTDAAVVITGRRGTLQGVGMRGRLDVLAWELLSDVQARLLPFVPDDREE